MTTSVEDRVNISAFSEVQDPLLDPGLPQRTPIPPGMLDPSLELLCVRCWQAFEGFGRPACPECGGLRPSSGWSTMPYTFRDRYVFWRVLGRGGMGAVFLAHDQHQSEPDKKAVAIKVVPETGSPALREALKRMFEREASAASMLAQSPHFVRVTSHDIGVEPAYLAMEYIDWPTLRGLLRRGQGKVRPLSPVKVARIGIALLRGLATMHFHRIVHRDLKPDNIFVRRAGQGDDYEIKILDLGVWAYDTGDESSTRSLPGIDKREESPVGTYSYMSPEQMALSSVTAGSDLHTVGSVLWELATGKLPYPMPKRELPPALRERAEALKHLPDRPVAMPEGLYQVLAKAMAFDPQDRFPSAEAMKVALKDWVEGELARSLALVSESKGRFQLLAAQVDALRGQLAPAKDLGRDLDAFSDRLRLLERHAEEAAPEVLRQSTADADERFRRLGAELDAFALGVKQTVAEGEAATGDLPFATGPLGPILDAATPAPPAPARPWHVVFALGLVLASAVLVWLPPRGDARDPRAARVATKEAPRKLSPPELIEARMGPGHSAGYVGVTFEPGARTLASAAADGTVRFFRYDSGQAAGVISEPSGAILEAAYSPEGRLLATAGEDGAVRIYQAQTKRLLFTVPLVQGALRAVAFSADAKTLYAGGEDGILRTVVVPTGLEGPALPAAKPRPPRAPERTPKRHRKPEPPEPMVLPAPIRAIAVSGDHHTVAVARSDGTVTTWVDGEPRASSQVHAGGAYALAFSPDGSTLASGGADREVQLLDLARGHRMALAGNQHQVRSLAFSPDGRRLVSGGGDRTVRVFDLPSGRLLRTLEGHSGPVHRVAISPDSAVLASGSHDRSIVLWDLQSGDRLRSIAGRSAAISALASAPDGNTVAVAGDGLRLIDPMTGASRPLGGPRRGVVEAISYAPSGKTLASAGLDRVVRLTELESGRETELPLGDSWARALSYSPDGRALAAGTADGRVVLFDLEAGAQLGEVLRHEGDVRALAFVGGRIISGGDDGRVQIMEAEKLATLSALELGSPVRVLAASSSARKIAVGLGAGQVAILDEAGRLLRIHADLGAPVLSLAFAPRGDVIIAGTSDGSLHWLSTSDERRLADLAVHQLGVLALTVLPDGTTITGGGDGAMFKLGAGRALLGGLYSAEGPGWTDDSAQRQESRGPLITTK